MNRWWKIAGIIALVAVLAVSTVAFVSAQGPQAGQVNLWERMHEAIAKRLGVTVEQYDSAVDTAREDVLTQAVEEGILTEEQADRMRGRGQDGLGSRRSMPGGRFGASARGMSGPGNSLVAVAAAELDLTVEQLVDELEAGKTIADVATAKGVALETIVEAYIAPRAEFLAELVSDGRITQEKADETLAHMREEAEKHLEEAYPFTCDEEGHEGRSEDLGGKGRRGGISGTDRQNRFPGMMSQHGL